MYDLRQQFRWHSARDTHARHLHVELVVLERGATEAVAFAQKVLHIVEVGQASHILHLQLAQLLCDTRAHKKHQVRLGYQVSSVGDRTLAVGAVESAQEVPHRLLGVMLLACAPKTSRITRMSVLASGAVSPVRSSGSEGSLESSVLRNSELSLARITV